MSEKRGCEPSWRRMPTALAGFVGLALLAPLAFGCNTDLGSTSDPGRELEAIIRSQLPNQTENLFPGVVSNARAKQVNCVEQSSGGYECIVRLSYFDADFGRTITETVPITGSCDSESCIWRASE
jgi:hypothetical protein